MQRWQIHDLQRYHLKHLKLVCTFLLKRKNEEIIRIKHFSSLKNETILYHIKGLRIPL